MAIGDRYRSRARMRGVCLWRGSLCTALMLAACSRTSILDDDLTNASTGGAVPGAGTGASGGTAGSGTPSAGAPGASGAPSTGAGGAPSTGVAGGGAAGGSDPCASVTCTTPPAAVCKSTATATIYAAIGTCRFGACSYVPTDTPCGANKQCSGAGVCSECKADSSCGPTCSACGGETPRCKDLGTASECVGCVSDADCLGALPSCNLATNVCGPPPSCVGWAATCGPSGVSCCTSNIVTGVTSASFYRGYDGVTPGYTSQAYPAQVSNFRLDKYEITVGRFRRFVAAYSQNMIAAGAGANPNNGSDTGWNTAWNARMPASAEALEAKLKCASPGQTWTDAAGSAAAETLPINCISWVEAEAFCIWDGGRLPTEAEWNYAAAGGTEQRVYPWGSAAPDCSYANFQNSPSCTPPPPPFGAVNAVGSESPKGDGLWGQADLAGNVTEWVQDEAGSYPIPCDNCSDLTGALYIRMSHGGSFYQDASSLLSSNRGLGFPDDYILYSLGARCARPWWK